MVTLTYTYMEESSGGIYNLVGQRRLGSTYKSEAAALAAWEAWAAANFESAKDVTEKEHFVGWGRVYRVVEDDMQLIPSYYSVEVHGAN